MLILKKKAKTEAFSMYVVAYKFNEDSTEFDAKFVLTNETNTFASISDKGLITVSNDELGGSIEVTCYWNDNKVVHTIELSALDDANIGDAVDTESGE